MTDTELSRTALRRAQRSHTLSCLRQGIRQQKQQVIVAQSQVQQYLRKGPIDTVVLSLAIHSADCQALNYGVHHASHASCLAKSLGLKSKYQHKRDLRSHHDANIVKHSRLHNDNVDSASFSPMPPLPTAALSSDLEEFRACLFTRLNDVDQCGAPPYVCKDDLGGGASGISTTDTSSAVCSWCGLWQPIPGPRCSADNQEQAETVLVEELIDNTPGIDSQSSEILAPLVPDECSKGDSEHPPGDFPFLSPQMPCLDCFSIKDIGAAVACSWWHAELLQPYLALTVELNGGSVSTFQT
jgi:hypothetical protein